MTANRLLPILNLFGCVLITGIIVAQWLKEHRLDDTISGLYKELATTRDLLDTEQKRASALESDVVQLKESVQATMDARKESEEALAKIIAEGDALKAVAASADQANQEQVTVWQKAVNERDEKIRSLNESLKTTRARLDEAIAKLKEAGAR